MFYLEEGQAKQYQRRTVTVSQFDLWPHRVFRSYSEIVTDWISCQSHCWSSNRRQSTRGSGVIVTHRWTLLSPCSTWRSSTPRRGRWKRSSWPSNPTTSAKTSPRTSTRTSCARPCTRCVGGGHRAPSGPLVVRWGSPWRQSHRLMVCSFRSATVAPEKSTRSKSATWSSCTCRGTSTSGNTGAESTKRTRTTRSCCTPPRRGTLEAGEDVTCGLSLLFFIHFNVCLCVNIHTHSVCIFICTRIYAHIYTYGHTYICIHNMPLYTHTRACV